jgi:hypothetical protein
VPLGVRSAHATHVHDVRGPLLKAWSDGVEPISPSHAHAWFGIGRVGRVVESEQAFTTSRGPLTGGPVSTSLGPGIGHIEFKLSATVRLISAITQIDAGWTRAADQCGTSRDPA